MVNVSVVQNAMRYMPQRSSASAGVKPAPYEFGSKVSIVTPVTSRKGGQFALHAKALHGNPFDGHTVAPVIADMKKLTGVEVLRIHVSKGYRGSGFGPRVRSAASRLLSVAR